MSEAANNSDPGKSEILEQEKDVQIENEIIKLLKKGDNLESVEELIALNLDRYCIGIGARKYKNGKLFKVVRKY